MKLYNGSTALYLGEIIGQYGNLPYHALKLLPVPFETAKDAAQKLMRAGLVKSIKVPHCKTLYLTAEGKVVVREKWPDGFYMGPVVYDPQKAARAALVNEALLFVRLAGIERDFPSIYGYTPYEFPAYMTASDFRAYARRVPHGDDNLMYSRFAGILRREHSCSIVYHFGHCNRVLNPNGETNVETAVRGLYKAANPDSKTPAYLNRLILANSTSVLGDIIRFSLRYAEMPRAKRAFLDSSKRPFPMKHGETDALFLPTAKDTMPVLRVMQETGWPSFADRLATGLNWDGKIVNLLDCRIASWLSALADSDDSSSQLILCYSWQRELADELFADLAERRRVYVAAADADEVEESFRKGSNVRWHDAYRLLLEGGERA